MSYKEKIIYTETIDMSDSHGIGGAGLYLNVEFLDNGDKVTYNKPGYEDTTVKESGIFMNQKITLQSYGNSASIELYGNPLTPDLLRDMANKLEKAEIKATQMKIDSEKKSKRKLIKRK